MLTGATEVKLNEQWETSGLGEAAKDALVQVIVGKSSHQGKNQKTEEVDG